MGTVTAISLLVPRTWKFQSFYFRSFSALLSLSLPDVTIATSTISHRHSHAVCIQRKSKSNAFTFPLAAFSSSPQNSFALLFLLRLSKVLLLVWHQHSANRKHIKSRRAKKLVSENCNYHVKNCPIQLVRFKPGCVRRIIICQMPGYAKFLANAFYNKFLLLPLSFNCNLIFCLATLIRNCYRFCP